ncbi:MAG: M1 family metallopeptidase, partial [Flavobacteriaceae bacterium]|nr:M1 family metallopeptidase [Flavobacteriaceae bacterium]
MRLLLLIIILAGPGSFYAQQTEVVDFKRAGVDVWIGPDEKIVYGSVSFEFEILKPTDSIYIDARNMRIEEIRYAEEKIAFDYDEKRIVLKRNWLPGKTEELLVRYRAWPKKAMYFLGWDNAAPDEVWTQGQGKYTSHWLPSFDDMNEKLEFDIEIHAPKGFMVASNGKLISSTHLPDNQSWKYDMDRPMSSYLVALAIGKYQKQTLLSRSGVPMELYYRITDSNRFEPTYRYSKAIFDFLETEIGVSYPWQNYKQIPVHDFLYAGMENTGATIFSDEFVIDSIAFNDRNYVRVNAHELAHQWFGNLVTETSGTHHWLHEGFASYYALLAERHLFGDDHFYWSLYKS